MIQTENMEDLAPSHNDNYKDNIQVAIDVR